MTTHTKTIILRPAGFQDDNLSEGSSIYREQVAGYFDEFLVESVSEVKEQRTPALGGPDRASRRCKIVGAYSRVETGSYQEYVDNEATTPLYGSYCVECEPGDDGAFEAQVFIPAQTLLNLRLTGPLPADGNISAVLQDALDVLAEAGFVERVGCTIRTETSKRVHVLTYDGQVLAASVFASDSSHHTPKGSGLISTQVADPRTVVGS
jgi:hypothetical protein